MPTISQVLKTNKVLTFLNISGNAIGNEGLLSLVSGLKGNKILEFLGIANNDISFNGIQALMDNKSKITTKRLFKTYRNKHMCDTSAERCTCLDIVRQTKPTLVKRVSRLDAYSLVPKTFLMACLNSVLLSRPGSRCSGS